MDSIQSITTVIASFFLSGSITLLIVSTRKLRKKLDEIDEHPEQFIR